VSRSIFVVPNAAKATADENCVLWHSTLRFLTQPDLSLIIGPDQVEDLAARNFNQELESKGKERKRGVGQSESRLQLARWKKK